MSLLDKFRAAKGLAATATCAAVAAPVKNSVAPNVVSTVASTSIIGDISVQKVAVISVGLLAAVYVVPKVFRRFFPKKKQHPSQLPQPQQADELKTAGLELESWDALPKANHVALFYTTWCGYSRKILPVWEQAIKLQSDISRCVRVNGDTFKEAATTYKIPGYPSIIALDENNDLIESYAGPRTVEGLQVFMTKHLSDGGNDINSDDGSDSGSSDSENE